MMHLMGKRRYIAQLDNHLLLLVLLITRLNFVHTHTGELIEGKFVDTVSFEKWNCMLKSISRMRNGIFLDIL